MIKAVKILKENARKECSRVLKSAWSENRQLRGYKQLFLSKIAARRAAKILGAQKFQKGPPGFQKGTRVILRKRRGPRFRGQGSLGGGPEGPQISERGPAFLRGGPGGTTPLWEGSTEGIHAV